MFEQGGMMTMMMTTMMLYHPLTTADHYRPRSLVGIQGVGSAERDWGYRPDRRAAHHVKDHFGFYFLKVSNLELPEDGCKSPAAVNKLVNEETFA